MAGNIMHAKVSIMADDPNYDILPSDWNAAHTVPASIPNITPTAAGDHINGKADGTWEKKTLAEEKTVLGITSATGQMIEVKYISGVPHKQLWIGGWKPTITAGCSASDRIEMGTNKNVYDYLPFDGGSVDENAYANIPLPQDYTGGVIYAKPYWTHPATTTNFKVAWGLQAVAIDNDGALDVAQGTAQTSLDEGGTTSDLYIGPQTSAITIAGTPTAGKLVNWNCYRDASDTTNDTLAVDAYLLGWMIWYPVG